MTDTSSTPPDRQVGPTLPIVASVLALLGVIPALLVAMFSVFASDPGNISGWATLFIYACWITPVLCVVGAAGSWIAWGVTRRHRTGPARIVRGAVYLLPLAGVLLIAISVLGTTVFCDGSLSC